MMREMVGRPTQPEQTLPSVEQALKGLLADPAARRVYLERAQGWAALSHSPQDGISKLGAAVGEPARLDALMASVSSAGQVDRSILEGHLGLVSWRCGQCGRVSQIDSNQLSDEMLCGSCGSYQAVKPACERDSGQKDTVDGAEGLFELDAHGHFLRGDASWYRMSSLGRELCEGFGWTNVVSMSDRATLHKQWAFMTQTGKGIKYPFDLAGDAAVLEVEPDYSTMGPLIFNGSLRVKSSVTVARPPSRLPQAVRQSASASSDLVERVQFQEKAAKAAGRVPRIIVNSMIGMGLVALVFGLVLTSIRSGDVEGEPMLNETAEVREPADLMSQAIESFRAFSQAKTVDEKLRWVRSPEEVKPMMLTYYQQPHLPKEAIVEVIRSAPIDMGDVPFVALQGKTERGDTTLAMLEVTADGRMLLDWKAFVGVGEMAWSAFLQWQPNVPQIMRVVIEPDNYFNFRYSDMERYLCYRIYDKNDSNACYAYVDRRSEAGQALAATFASVRMADRIRSQPEFSSTHEDLKPGARRMTLRLSFDSEDRGEDQVRICDFVSDDWVDVSKRRWDQAYWLSEAYLTKN